MSFLTRIFETRSSEQTLSLRDPALKDLWGWGTKTVSGVSISESSALKIGAVYACINDISQDIAKMPFHTFENLGEGKGRRMAMNHPAFRMLKKKPNPWMTSLILRHLMQSWILSWGNAFAEIERNPASGRLMALWPWAPNRVRLQVFNRKLFYYYTDFDGVERQFRADQVLHLRGLGDEFLGYSVISLHRESLGLCQASLEYRARFFANDARPGGVFEHPGKLSGPAHDNLRKDLREKLGSENQRSFAILEEGMKWHDVGIPPNDAQYIEGWNAGKEDIAGIFRMPPYKIGILKPGTVSHSSVEQAALDYYQDCLLFWVECWEQGCDSALFTEAESQRFYTKMKTDSILRADSKTRAETLQIWRRNGILSANEWRELEDRNPLPGPEGDTYIVEGNMTTLEKVGENSGDDDEPTPSFNGNGNGVRPNGAAK